ncbi:oxidoreductase-like protein [Podospora didyma]|uniref:Oxidoreductase-like protein n=1 Tax=Podospora didyma TaxID=330526 RepID=A0AAE0NGK7_9PEZI|nr:oxidoreductase-like protein [Podospora didyma]
MVGIALLGAGIFARTEHLPAVETASSLFELKAVYSRSQSSATELATASKNPSAVAIYFDSPSVPGQGLADLLARDDISAVIVALPILTQPAIIRQAIEAGKHVLSEKPVAGDLGAAIRLIGWYDSRSAPGKPIWAVAENFRFIDNLDFAAEKLREIGGNVVTFSLKCNNFVQPDNKYFNTAWRKVPEYQGGFLLDGGVHFVAALRLLLGAGGQQIRQLVGFSGLLEEHLLPVDTIQAVARTQDGKIGSISLSFGTEFKSGLEVEIVTTKGAVTWTPTKVSTFTKKDGKEAKEEKEFTYNSGVKNEVVAFGEAIAAGKADERQTPKEALKDLEILEKLLKSGDQGAAVKEVQDY